MSNRLKVLIVDDNVDLATSMAWMVEGLGHAVMTAASGGDGIRAAGTFQPDIIFLDIGLPDMDGYEACRAIRLLPGLEATVFVAQTGRDDDSDRDKAADAGFRHFTVKPAPMAQIADILAEVVAGA